MSSSTLKRIASAAMLIYYIGVYIPGAPMLLRWIGQLAVPLFFYCMAWSMDKTRDKKAYITRLYLFSVGMALVNLLLSIVVQKTGLVTTVTSNIFATLFAGAFTIHVIEFGRKHPKRRKKLWISYAFWQILFAGLWAVLYELVGVPYAILNLASAVLGSALTCEGAFMYILMGVLFYYTKEDKKRLAIGYAGVCLIYFLNSALGVWGRIFMLIGNDVLVALMEILTGLVLWGASHRPVFDVAHMFHNDFHWMMILALPLLWICTGKRKKGHPYFYYIFYPAQLYLLWFIGTVLLG